MMKIAIAFAAIAVATAAATAAPTGLDHQDPEVVATFERLVGDVSAVDATWAAEGECHECVKTGIEEIMKHIFEHVKEECEKATCPFVQRVCGHIAEHPEFFAGFVFVKARPPQSAVAYCFGKGSCTPPAADALASVSGDFQLMNNLPQNLTIATTSPVDMAAISDALDEEEGAVEETEDGDSDSDSDGDHDGHHGHHGMRRFARCVGFVARMHIEHIIGGIVEFCRHTECPRAKEWCHSVREHHEAFTGSLIARDQPEKFAAGVCVAMMHRHHGHHDHHGRHGHHGHHGHHGRH